MGILTKLNKFVLIAGLFFAGQAWCDGSWWNVASSEEPPKEKIDNKDFYLVSTAEQLAWVSKASFKKDGDLNWSGNVKLMADIDLGGKLWVPISVGSGGRKFQGVFDGAGHTISNMYIRGAELIQLGANSSTERNNQMAQNLGLFGTLNSATVKNLTLSNIDIYATSNKGVTGCSGCGEISIGAVVGWIGDNGATIENVNVSGSITTSGSGQAVGGIAGYVHKANISNCASSVDFYASGSNAIVGGILGVAGKKGGSDGMQINLTSVVYNGSTLVNTGSESVTAAIAGEYRSGTMTPTKAYYDTDLGISGVGKVKSGAPDSASTNGVGNLNADDVVCALNGGKITDGVCTGDSSDVWAVGLSDISLNGSDGFKITFSAHGGTFPAGAKTTKTLLKGKQIIADEIGIPTKESEAFAGWALDSTASEPADDLGLVSGPETIYAVWNPVFTVTFDANGGLFPPEADGVGVKEKQVAYGEPITVEGLDSLPFTYCKASQEGEACTKMYFTGWAYTADAAEDSVLDLNSLKVLAEKDTRLYAVWTEAETYTVTFHADGHGKTKVSFVKVEAGTKLSPMDAVADDGYSFEGWFTESNGGTKFSFDSTSINENIILYAHWSKIPYTIVYELNEGTNSAGNPESYDIETETFLFEAPTRDGFVFEGWFYDAGYTTRATQVTKGSTGNKNVYARWTPLTYTVSYLAGSSALGTIPSDTKSYGDSLVLKGAVESFVRRGYSQTGWSKIDGGNKDYDLGEYYTENANLILYPTWAIDTFTVTYVCEGCENKTSNPTKYTIDKTWNIGYPTSVPEGYSFGGWFSNTKYQNKVTQLHANKAYGDTTLYGKLNKIYKITYVGTENPDNETTYTVDDEKTFKAPKDSAGYIFGGWFANAEFEGDAVTGIAKGTTGDKTFYAKWIPNTYTITYVAGDFGEGSIESGTKTHDVGFELSTEKFTRSGYTQDGWENANGDIVSSPYTENADITLYPHWEINTYTITYVVNGNNIDETPNTYTFEESVVFPASLSIDGYDFLWWEDENGNLIEGLSAGGSVGNRTITARLSAVEYVINYVLNGGVFEGDYPETYTIAGEPSLPTPVKSGFKFLGWKNENDEIVESIPANSTGNITLTAQWAEYPVLVATYGGVSIYENENKTTSALIDDEAMTPISIPENVTVDQVSFNRIFNVGKASTIVLPFSIDTANVHGGVFYTVSLKKKDNGHWQAGGNTVRTAQLTANTPYIVIVKSEDGMLTFDGPVTFNTSVVNNSITDNGDGSSWSFKGTYVYHKWNAAETADGNIYGFAARNASGAKAGEFVQFAAGAWLRPMRAYLEYTPSTEASPADPEFNPRPVMMSIDDFVLPESIDFILGEDDVEVFTTTFTKRNSNVGNAKASDRWFDMSGRLLNAKPTTKGIYYYNGKRVLVK